MWYISNSKVSKWINIIIENPFKTWWKAKKYFKIPKISFKIHRVSKISGYPYASYKWIGKLLDIYIRDVRWKDKFNSPRHELNPIVWICLFRNIALWINFHIDYKDEFSEKQNGDMEYWEYILNWLYYKNKQTLRCYSTWIGNSKLYKTCKYGNAEDGSEDTWKALPYIVPCVSMSLNKQGIKELKRELNEENRNTTTSKILG